MLRRWIRKKLITHQRLGCIEFVDILKIVFPTTYEISVKESATNITGTVAKPSSPSVKFTALDAPIITNKPKGIKKFPFQRLNF